MRRFHPFVAGISFLVFAACSGSGTEQTAATPVSTSAPRQAAAPQSEALAYFAGGCFWGVEHYMEQLDGVLAVDSGYMGGSSERPTYEQVSTGSSGHLEAVRVRFDENKLSYEAVARRFFEIHDPTQGNGQGPDIGAQYLSAVFYDDADQKKTTESLIEILKGRGFDVVTDVFPATTFWPAEDYHQDYYGKNGKKPYCHTLIRRFGDA